MDDFQVKLTDQAVSHLRNIRDYISNRLLEPNLARNLIELLYKKIKTLSHLPKRHKIIDDIPSNEYEIRKLIVKNYYIYYLVCEEDKTVTVIAVIFSRRNQDTVFEGLKQ